MFVLRMYGLVSLLGVSGLVDAYICVMVLLGLAVIIEILNRRFGYYS